MVDAEEIADSVDNTFVLRRWVLKAFFALSIAFARAELVAARNLPEENGASGKLRGTIEGLVPIVRLEAALDSAEASLPDLQKVSRALASMPDTEKDFKRIFDEYSNGISYKQQYLDKNAFLVYYTKGFDGADRPSIETESSEESKQKEQYGQRNAAWINVDDARSELTFLSKNPPDSDDDLIEIRGALSRARSAFSSYLSLAPAEQVSAAKGLAR